MDQQLAQQAAGYLYSRLEIEATPHGLEPGGVPGQFL
jgi:hypothetical protein